MSNAARHFLFHRARKAALAWTGAGLIPVLWFGAWPLWLTVVLGAWAVLWASYLASAWRTDLDLAHALAAPDRQVMPFFYAGFIAAPGQGIHLRLEPAEYDALRELVVGLPARAEP